VPNINVRMTIEIRDWLDANAPRSGPLHPTSRSWQVLIEVGFGIIERQAIHRGTFRAVKDLNAKTRAFVDGWKRTSR
jgi:hypothetical protein